MSLPRAVLLALVVLSAGACHRTQAARLPAPPVALEVPQPPSRVHIPVTLADYEPPPPAPEPPPPQPPASKPAASRPADRPAAAAAPPPAAEGPAAVLQTSANPQAMEQVQTLIQSAVRDLSRVHFDQLSTWGKGHYQQAQSYLNAARDALKINNYGYAAANAEKAAKIAEMLVP